MSHELQLESIKDYRNKSGHEVNYYNGGHRKEQPTVPRNKNPNKVWDGSETVAINARHK